MGFSKLMERAKKTVTIMNILVVLGDWNTRIDSHAYQQWAERVTSSGESGAVDCIQMHDRMSPSAPSHHPPTPHRRVQPATRSHSSPDKLSHSGPFSPRDILIDRDNGQGREGSQ
ncbi:uncharacterized protein LOC112556560 [Pomacea canaliculata]|uniref:uncharacterized protein LOC112556560 n=1 Tax=Pomacea canaliculata TaxID=400727 RepID=UPI000D72AC3C|nr:uncharacterized protein LOC112556560 [Pomacea canaliculata]